LPWKRQIPEAMRKRGREIYGSYEEKFKAVECGPTCSKRRNQLTRRRGRDVRAEKAETFMPIIEKGGTLLGEEECIRIIGSARKTEEK